MCTTIGLLWTFHLLSQYFSHVYSFFAAIFSYMFNFSRSIIIRMIYSLKRRNDGVLTPIIVIYVIKTVINGCNSLTCQKHSIVIPSKCTLELVKNTVSQLQSLHLAVGTRFFTSLPVVGPQAPQFQSFGSRAALRNRFGLADTLRVLDATHALTSSRNGQRMFRQPSTYLSTIFMMRHQPLNLHTSWRLYSLNSNLKRHLNVTSQ